MVIGTLLLVLQIPGAHSLKSRRQVLRSVIDRVRSRYNASIAEVADQERWQTATLGVAVVANERAFVGEVLDKIFQTVDDAHEVTIAHFERQIASAAELEDGEEGPRTLAEAEGLDPFSRRR